MEKGQFAEEQADQTISPHFGWHKFGYAFMNQIIRDNKK